MPYAKLSDRKAQAGFFQVVLSPSLKALASAYARRRYERDRPRLLAQSHAYAARKRAERQAAAAKAAAAELGQALAVLVGTAIATPHDVHTALVATAELLQILAGVIGTAAAQQAPARSAASSTDAQAAAPAA